MVLLYLINFPDLITNFEKVLNKITNEISDKIEKYSTKDFKIAIVVISVSKTLNIVGIYFSGYKFSKTIRQIVAIKSIIDVLNLSTSSWSKVLELFLLLSWLYRFFEKGEVAIIDNAVIEKPVVIDKKVATTSKALLFKLKLIAKKDIAKTEMKILSIILSVFIFYFTY